MCHTYILSHSHTPLPFSSGFKKGRQPERQAWWFELKRLLKCKNQVPLWCSAWLWDMWEGFKATVPRFWSSGLQLVPKCLPAWRCLTYRKWEVGVGGEGEWVGREWGREGGGGVLLMWLLCHWPCLGRAGVELENENTFHLRPISSHFLLSLGKKKKKRVVVFFPRGARSPDLVLNFPSFYNSLRPHSSGSLQMQRPAHRERTGPGPVAEAEYHRLVELLWWHHQRE